MNWEGIGKRIAAGAVALSLTACLAGVVPAGAVDDYFTAPSGWAAADLERAEDEGLLLPAFFNRDLQGDITRREFAVLAVTLAQKLGLPVDPYDPDLPEAPFTDMESVFGKPYVSAAWSMGLMNGVSATEFAPLRTITRMEICTLLSRIMEKCGVTLPETVSGVAERLDSGAEGAVPGWAKAGVVEIAGAGLMQGSGGSLALTAQTSREQAMVLALRTMDMAGEILEEQNFTAAEREKIAQLRELRATFGDPGEPYAQEPSTSAPYSLGKVNDAYLQDGLNTINYARAIAGLAPVAMSEEKNQSAQAGAVLLVAGGYGHYPSQPADMPDDFYKQGYAATSTSNIGMGHDDLSDFTLSCLDDSDSSNYTRVGHRRWLLDPDLTTVGLGCADRRYTTKVVGDTYVPWGGPEYVTWPSEGVFPMELFREELVWSCSFSPNVYTTDREDITVTVTDGSGNTWSKQASNGQIDTDFVLVEGSNYGGAPAVLFRPAGLEYRTGAPLTVTISGLHLKSGGTGTITYTVKLF